jgi:hypothetical protein
MGAQSSHREDTFPRLCSHRYGWRTCLESLKVEMIAFAWSFPPEIFREHVFSFLNMRSLSRLDEAAANHKIRTLLHERLTNHVHRTFDGSKMKVPVIKWMKSRSVFLEAIDFFHELTDVELALYGEGMLHTKSISYRSCNKFNIQALSALVSFPTKLRELELRLCPFITDESVTAITTAHTSLESLKLEFCKVTSTGVASILQNCTNLTTLSLTGCRLMITPGLTDLPWHRCSHVTTLGLAKISILSDSDVEGIVEHMPNLTSLDLSWSANITDHSIVYVTERCPGLQRLDLELLSKVTDTSMLALAANSPHLRELNTNWCSKITTAGFVQLVTHCTRLDDLDLTRCEVVDEAVHALALHCPHLRRLNLYECYKLTDSAVLALAAHCTKLDFLCIIECRKLTAASKTAFPAGCRVVTVRT